MKKLILFIVIAMLSVSSCGFDDYLKTDRKSEEQEERKMIRPMRIGGKWYYFYW